MVSEALSVEDDFVADTEYGDVYTEWGFVLLDVKVSASSCSQPMPLAMPWGRALWLIGLAAKFIFL